MTSKKLKVVQRLESRIAGLSSQKLHVARVIAHIQLNADPRFFLINSILHLTYYFRNLQAQTLHKPYEVEKISRVKMGRVDYCFSQWLIHCRRVLHEKGSTSFQVVS